MVVSQPINGVIAIPPSLIRAKAKKNEMIYLSDFMERLPSNCIFLKGVTGCGATTLALRDESNCIIALPTRNTVSSKWVIRDDSNNIIGYNSDFFCVFGGFHDTPEELQEYISFRQKNNMPTKIVCTYDQVGNIVSWLTNNQYSKNYSYISEAEENYITDMCKRLLSNFRLYVDEIHQVLDDYKTKERRPNIRAMLQCIKFFPDVTCITATPLEEKYFFKEIRHLPVIRVAYPITPRDIKLRKVNYLSNECANIITDYLEGKTVAKNAHIFVNSVSFIADTIKKIDYSKYGDRIRVVCSDTKENAEKIRKAITRAVGKDILNFGLCEKNLALEVDRALIESSTEKVLKGISMPITSINSEVKTINFYTRTAWLGADIFDKYGQIYIFSDGARPYTMADISTSYIQILGRIRDSQNRVVYHYYTQNRFIKDGENFETEFEKDEKNRAKNTKDLLELFDKNPELALYIPEEKRETKCYLETRTHNGVTKLCYDEYLQWNDEISYKIVRGDYASAANMSAKMYKVGLNTIEDIDATTAEKIASNKKAKILFTDVMKNYIDYMAKNSLFGDDLSQSVIGILEAREPLLHSAYTLLGAEKIKQLGYKKREIKREVELAKLSTDKRRIQAYLRLQNNKIYTVAELKEKCETTQKILGLDKKIRISEFYDILYTTKRIDGKITKACKVIKKL